MPMQIKALAKLKIDLGDKVYVNPQFKDAYKEQAVPMSVGIVEDFDVHPLDRDLVKGVLVKFLGQETTYGLIPPEHLLSVEG